MAADHDWPMVKLGDVCTSVDRWRKDDDLDWQYIDISSIESESKSIVGPSTITSTTAPSRATTVTQAGDVLVSTVRPNLNAVAAVPVSLSPSIASSGLSVLRTDPKIADSRYLFHVVQTPGFIQRACDLATGASYPAVSDSKIRTIQIPVPPLSEQRRIAKILEASQQSISKLKTLRAELLPTVFNLLEQAQQDRSATLDDFIEDISSGRNVADTKEPHPHNQVLRVSAVTTGVFNRDEAKPLPESYVPPKNHRVTPGDVLVSRANTTELLGASAIAPPGVNDMYLPDKLWRVLPKEGVDPYLLWGILNTKTVRARISQRSTGSSGSMKNISQKNFLSVPCSSITSFDAYRLAQVPKTALEVLELTGKKLSLLEELHASLSARAFAGKL